MGNSNLTFFGVGGGGGGSGSASSYLQDNFQNTTNPANSNGVLTSNPNNNPLGLFFANDSAVQYNTKTVWVKDLVLIQDRSKWISNKPTYQIVWSEVIPGIQGYCFGNIRLKNTQYGVSVDVRDIGDGIAICGVIENIGWLANASVDASATAEVFLDGVDQSAALSFGGAPTNNQPAGLNQYDLQWHKTSAQAYGIHEYRLVASTYRDLNITGVVAYFNNATNNIDVFPGSIYVDMTKVTTLNNVGLTLPIMAGSLGARSIVQITAQSQYQAVTVETPFVNTIAQGVSGSNLLTVTTGQGASFPPGLGIIGALGSSFYVGQVLSQSTDTLTVGPTLPFGFSGTLYRAWSAGSTFAISATLYSLKATIDPKMSNTFIDPNGFGTNANGPLYFSDPELKYRLWGDNLTIGAIEGYQGLGFVSNTLGFFQVDGQFCAAEIEVAGAGILHGTFSINGVPSWGINTGVSAIQRYTVFTDAGPGLNSFYFAPGASFVGIDFIRINLYGRANPGASGTILSSFDTTINPVNRFSDAANASLMPLGGWNRLYADNLYLNGSWVRGITSTAAGGVLFAGASTNSVFTASYYGKDFELIGTAGSSTVLTFNGASITVAFNKRVSAAIGFNTVSFTHHGGTSIISAFDFLSPQQTEFKNEELYLPSKDSGGDPVVFVQADTPRSAKQGDIWVLSKTTTRAVFIYLFGQWNQISMGQILDDPNDPAFYKLKGSTTGAAGQSTNSLEIFNFLSWSIPSATSATSNWSSSEGDCAYLNSVYWIDGINTSSAFVLLTEKFNKFSWNVLGSNRANSRALCSQAVFNGLLTIASGLNAGSATTGTIDTFNGASWNNAIATFAVSVENAGAFVFGGKFRSVGGYNGGSNIATHSTWDGSSVGTDTVVPAANGYAIGGNFNANGLVGAGGNTATSYTWSGSWSTAFTMPYVAGGSGNPTQQTPASGSFPSAGKFFTNGGSDTVVAVKNSTTYFDGVAWTLFTSSLTSVSSCSGGIT